MSVQIKVLYDNRCSHPDLQEGWGFSAYIEYTNAKILFDTGGDAKAVFANASKLQFKYDEVTHLLFSHRHWDHLAGFNEIIEKMNQDTSLYVPKTFPKRLLRNCAKKLNKIRVVSAFEEIMPNIYALVLRGGFWLYEQALVLKTPLGLGIITGCAHPGIIKILQEAQKQLQTNIYFVLGGFHLLYAPAEESAKIVQQFQELNVQKVAPCHCSGDHLIRQFQQAYSSNFFKIGTGSILSF